ncbi:MAG: mechanosensitive ion channel [Deltaproteobacteria bacterium]|nr:mechanosensitive ion channel [Deltaproteobacteria bacterium]
MWSPELLFLLLQTVAIFIGLSLFYWIIFKALRWRSPLLRTLTARIRFWMYLFVPLIPLAWLLTQLDLLPIRALHPSRSLLRSVDSVLLVVTIIALVEAVSAFISDYLFAVRRNTPVPQIVQSLVRGVVYLLVFLFLLPQIFAWRDIAGLVTSSAILSVILGLALQETLGNLFAGIGMQITRPYLIGQWVKLGSHEGRIESADWRSVTILTRQGDHISFPQSMVAKMEIHNFSFPSRLHACEIRVGVHYKHPPSTVEVILLRCAREVSGVLDQPPPEVRLTDYLDFAVLYTIKLWIDDFSRLQVIESDVRKRMWYHFRREQITIPFPIRELHHQRAIPVTDAAAERLQLLHEIEFLNVLTDEQRQELARRLATQIFARGETICHQGEAGNTFYIIKSGQVEVSTRNGAGRAAVLRQMTAGEFFGEISLLTGEPRSATIVALEDTEVLTMNKEDMRAMLATNSQLADHMSEVRTLPAKLVDFRMSRLFGCSVTSTGASVPE